MAPNAPRGGDRVPPPPSVVNVQSIAESRSRELESLHAIVASRTNHDFRFPRGKRRRTTSFDDRKAKGKRRGRKRRKLGVTQAVATGENAVAPSDEREKKKKLSRRARRRMEFRENPASGFVVSADGTRRLRTHLWHAKRFTMVKKWGFFLPLGLNGRGRGSRSVLKWLKTGAIIHDASYFSPIEVQGPKDSILAVLKMVMIPSPSDLPEEQFSHEVCGVCFGSAMLHHVGASQFIAPATYMWRPSKKDDDDVEFGGNHVGNRCGSNEERESRTSVQQLWVWMHPASFSEGFDVLKNACMKETNESGVSVSCFSLEGQLAKFEVIGFKAINILQKLLHPLSDISSDSAPTRCTGSQLQKSSLLENAEHLPSRAVISLDVHDPRDLDSKLVKNLSETHPTRLDDFDGENQFDLVSRASRTSKEACLSLWTKPEESGTFLADTKDLWVTHDKLNPPKKENILCSEKHTRRLKYFYMDSTNDDKLTTENREGNAGSCPVLLLKNNNHSNTFTWWSVILPLSWARAFWVPLVSYGAQVIGLRERRWIACDKELPSYPFDFPDCKAYSFTMAAEAAASEQNAELRPVSVRPFKVPATPPWECLRSSIHHGPRIMEEFQTDDIQHCNQSCVTKAEDLNPGNSCSIAIDETSLFLGRCVTRTSKSLICHLRKMNGRRALLFPDCNMRKKVYSELIERKNFIWVPKSVIAVPVERKLHLLRVVLRSFKEGSFEGGAVICAPTYSDILLWTSRSEEDENLQIPQSSVQSYFTERDSGQWELQAPEDQPIRQSFRWPIGFVTTGFVRGSSRPVAQALCEATLLALLRGQQWGEMQEKARPEIFVLVRNLRSTAYRLALATVVLEQQKDDLDFF